MKRLLIITAYNSWNFPINESGEVIIERENITDTVANRINTIADNYYELLMHVYIWCADTKTQHDIIKNYAVIFQDRKSVV